MIYAVDSEGVRHGPFPGGDALAVFLRLCKPGWVRLFCSEIVEEAN